MDVNEILKAHTAGKATLTLVDGMIRVERKQYDKSTGKLTKPKVEYFSLAELEAKKLSVINKVDKLSEYVDKVNQLLSLI